MYYATNDKDESDPGPRRNLVVHVALLPPRAIRNDKLRLCSHLVCSLHEALRGGERVQL